MKNLIKQSLIGLFALTLAAPLTQAAVITYSGLDTEDKGTGLGTTNPILVVQNNGSEYGTTTWNGSTNVRTGDAKSQGATRTVADLSNDGINGATFGIVFNVAEPGKGDTLDLHDFKIVFQNDAGTVLFTADFDADTSVPTVSGLLGTGQGKAGYLFPVTFSPAELSFFNTSTNRVGMEILSAEAIANTGGAFESFYVTAIPEPSSAVLIVGAMSAMLFRRRRSNKIVAKNQVVATKSLA